MIKAKAHETHTYEWSQRAEKSEICNKQAKQFPCLLLHDDLNNDSSYYENLALIIFVKLLLALSHRGKLLLDISRSHAMRSPNIIISASGGTECLNGMKCRANNIGKSIKYLYLSAENVCLMRWKFEWWWHTKLDRNRAHKRVYFEMFTIN